MNFVLIVLSSLILFCTVETKSNLTLDTFFNYTEFNSLSLSPNGQYLLVQTRRPIWDLSRFESTLWMYQTANRQRKLITNQLIGGSKFQWSPSGERFFFLVNNNPIPSPFPDPNAQQYIHLYSTATQQVQPISIGTDIPVAITWGQDDSSLYYATIIPNAGRDPELRDVIQFRTQPISIIRRIMIDGTNKTVPSRTDITVVPFLINELLYSSVLNKLIFSTISQMIENMEIIQIYSIDLNNLTSITTLTTDPALKVNLQLRNDKKTVFFLTIPLGSTNGTSDLTQQRLYSIDLTNNLVQRWTADFPGNVFDYVIKSDGGVYIVGQLGINVQIYSQLAPNKPTVLHAGFPGTYLLISSSVNSIAFVFSSFSKAQEAYLIQNINQLKSAVPLTNENNQYDKIDLPQGQVYQWKSKQDNQAIEGILHYPPGKCGEKNLPLLVLIHGGPGEASINQFFGNWYFWAPLAAAAGWLVLEPNYRGSTGYGDQFTNAIRHEPLTLPGRDILDGVDQLIRDRIADRTKLTIGGYSYGGILTNWLITQTTRFNAAVSGAGTVEQVSFWGMTDIPTYIADLFGGFPWKIPKTYQQQSPIYHFDRVRTPTHIVAGGNDVRVPIGQSIMMERALHYLGIPVQLLILPNEGHFLSIDPWHGKIKVREEIKWLQLYG